MWIPFYSAAWLAAIVLIRGRGSAHQRALACFESLGWTLVLAVLLHALLPQSDLQQMQTVAFLLCSEVLGGLGACIFLFLADPHSQTDAEGTGLTPLKGE